MSRAWGIFIGSAVALATAAPAAAQSFGGLVEDAQSVKSGPAVAALFWSQSADCAGAETDLARRQCRGLVAARKDQLSSATFVLSGDAAAVAAGDYDSKKKAVPVTLRACVACKEPLDIIGSRVFVVAGSGAVAGAGGGVTVQPAATAAIEAKNKADARRIADSVVPRLKSQFIVKLGEQPKGFKAGQAAGFRVELVGYRLYDPCDGKVYAARPKSSSVTPDKRYCSGEPVAEDPAPVAAKPAKKEPVLPRALSPGQIRDGLEPARQAARKCFEAYGVPGTARFRITISGEGEVIGLREKGDFVGTPTSKCIRKAVRTASFPRSRKARTTIDYPFILR